MIPAIVVNTETNIDIIGHRIKLLTIPRIGEAFFIHKNESIQRFVVNKIENCVFPLTPNFSYVRISVCEMNEISPTE